MERNMYNLTNPQKSIWLTEQFYKNTPMENITGCVTVLEKLNLKALQKAIKTGCRNTYENRQYRAF